VEWGRATRSESPSEKSNYDQLGSGSLARIKSHRKLLGGISRILTNSFRVQASGLVAKKHERPTQNFHTTESKQKKRGPESPQAELKATKEKMKPNQTSVLMRRRWVDICVYETQTTNESVNKNQEFEFVFELKLLVSPNAELRDFCTVDEEKK